MTLVVINACYGGFGLSKEAYEWMTQHGYQGLEYHTDWDPPRWTGDNDIPRDHPLLIQCLRELGYDKASDHYSRLRIVDVPRFKRWGRVRWQIDEYDGFEWVAEQHQRWHFEGDDDE